MSPIHWTGAVVAVVLCGSAALGAQLTWGDRAPEFEGAAARGGTITLDDFLGKQVLILYFYPGDLEAASILQARLIKAKYEWYHKFGAEVVGVSADALETHEEFILREELPFPLISDPEGRMARAYGVSIRGGRAVRATFVVDKAGNVRYSAYRVLIAQQVDEIRKVVGTLAGEQGRRRLEAYERRRRVRSRYESEGAEGSEN